MFISNISQNQSTKFSFKSNIQKCFPARELILEKLDNKLAKQLGVKVPTTKDEQKTVVSKIYEQLHMIMLSLDKLSPILRHFKMPSTIEERDAQIEFLENRKSLDKWVQLIFKRFELKANRNMLSHLKYDNPNISKEIKAKLIPHLPQMERELEKAGDFEAALRSLNSQISYEEMSNPRAVEYFKNLEKLKAIYEKNGLITEDMEDNYWQILEDESINKTNLSVGQLLELVQKHSKVQTSSAQLTKAQKAEIKAQKKAAEAARKAQKEAAAKARKEAAQKLEEQKRAEKLALTEKKRAEKAACAPKEKIKTDQTKQSVAGRVEVQKNGNKYLTRNQLLETAKREYSLYLRRHIDFYVVMNDAINNTTVAKDGVLRVNKLRDVAIEAKDKILDSYKDNIERLKNDPTGKNAGIRNQLLSAFEEIRDNYAFKAGQIGNLGSLQNIGKGWEMMDELIKKIKVDIKNIDEIKLKLKTEGQKQNYIDKLDELEEQLLKDKKEWKELLVSVVKLEELNREISRDKGLLGVYNFITSESKLIKHYKEIYQIYEENNGMLPAKTWSELLA